jgi:hypothetical protein
MQSSIPESKNVALLLVGLRDDDISQISSHISQAIDLIHAQNGTVFHVVSSIVIATFDFGADPPSDPEKRCEIAAENIRLGMGKRAKALYGDCKAVYGDFGSPTRIHFGPFIPRLSSLVRQLQNLDFGTVSKLDHSK